jgi:hypothetical protein
MYTTIRAFRESFGRDIDFGSVENNPSFLKELEKEGSAPGYKPDRDTLAKGLCWLVAKWMVEQYPMSGRIWASFNSMGLMHAVAKIRGKFYDGLNPEGVDRLEDMEFFKDKPEMARHMREFSSVEQFMTHYDEEYAESDDEDDD